jgi:hypothetical protein
MSFGEYKLIEAVKNATTLDMSTVLIFSILLFAGFALFITIPVLSVFYVINAFQGKGKTAHKIGKINAIISILAPILISVIGTISNFVNQTYEFSQSFYGISFGSTSVTVKVAESLFHDDNPMLPMFFTLIALIFGVISLKSLRNNPPLNSSPFSGTSGGIDKEKVTEITKGVIDTAGKFGNSAKEIGKSIGFSAENEDNATAGIAGRTFNAGLVIRIISIVLVILFFLPVVSISYYYTDTTANGWATAFGIRDGGMRVGGNFIFIFLLLIPVALFVAYQFKEKIPFIQGKLFLISSGLCVAGLLVYLIGFSALNGADGTGAGITFWSFVSILLYLLAGAVSVGCYFAGKKKK